MSESFIVVDEQTQYVSIPLSAEECSSVVLGLSNYGRTTRPNKLSVSLPSSFIRTSAPYGLSEHDVTHVKYSVSGAIFPDGTQIREEDYDPYSEYSWLDYNFACDSCDPDLSSSVTQTGYPFPALPRYTIVAPDGRTIASHVVGIVLLDDSFSAAKLLPHIPEHSEIVREYDWRSDSYKSVERMVSALDSDMAFRMEGSSKTHVRIITVCGSSFSVHEVFFCESAEDVPWPDDDGPNDEWFEEQSEDSRPRWYVYGYGGGIHDSTVDLVDYLRGTDLSPDDGQMYPEGWILPLSGHMNTVRYFGSSGFFGGPGDYKYNEARFSLHRVANDVGYIGCRLYSLPLMPPDTKETLTTHSLSDFRFISVNMLEFTRDLRELKRALKPLVDLWHKPLSPKSWANLWLSARFGLRLTLKDAEKIRLDINRKLKRRRGALAFQTSRSRQAEELVESHGNIKVERHQKMYFSPSSSLLRSAVEMIYATGFYPTPLAVWELIPYSFVVDWVLPVSKYLEHWDRKLEEGMAKYRLLYVQYSTKAVYQPCGFSRQSTVLYQPNGKRYRRWHESTFPVTAQHQSLTPEINGDLINIVDSVSLVIQRKR